MIFLYLGKYLRELLNRERTWLIVFIFVFAPIFENIQL